MRVKIFDDYTGLSEQVANEIIQVVKQKPDAVLCLAAGDTPKGPYTQVAKKAGEEKIDFSRCTFIGLDEWIGIPPENVGSCHYFLHHYLFHPLNIADSQIHVFNAMTGDLTGECKKMDLVIAAKGGIDLMVVGIGMNGHIGFNEPGVSFDNYSHVIDLDENTQSVGQKYFTEKMVLKKGITLGLKHFLEADKGIVIANGAKKASIVAKAVNGPLTNQVPASIIQQHSIGWVMIDKEAASQIIPDENK